MYCIFGQDLNGEQVPLVCGTEKECNEKVEAKAQEVERERNVVFDRLIMKQT